MSLIHWVINTKCNHLAIVRHDHLMVMSGTDEATWGLMNPNMLPKNPPVFTYKVSTQPYKVTNGSCAMLCKRCSRDARCIINWGKVYAHLVVMLNLLIWVIIHVTSYCITVKAVCIIRVSCYICFIINIQCTV